ncbi:hypothetical protein ACOSQ3_015074 [Xanthoceras sorbifolium]
MSTSMKLNFNLPIKLDRNNYLFWKAQALFEIRAYNIEDFIFESRPSPPKFVETISFETNEVIRRISNDFLIWKKNDQPLVCWLLSTLSESVMGEVISCVTAYKVWTILERLYAQQSKARILHLSSQMQSLKKGSVSISDYIMKIKSLADNLTTVGQLMTDQDVIMHVLHSLGLEYDSVIMIVTARQDSIPLSEVQYLLLTQEQRLKQIRSTATIDISNASAHLTPTGTLTVERPIMLPPMCIISRTSKTTKDLTTRKTLLRGIEKNGLHQLKLSGADPSLFTQLSIPADGASFLLEISFHPCNALTVGGSSCVNNVCSSLAAVHNEIINA